MRERTLTAVTQEKYLFSLCFDLLCRTFWNFFLFFSLFYSSVVVVNVYGTMKSNLVLNFFFFSVTLFIAVKNFCLYVGLWHFCAVSLSFLISILKFLNLLLFFYIYYLVCFSYCSFPLTVNLQFI